jgi:2-keto-4-pentenoate hydratase
MCNLYSITTNQAAIIALFRDNASAGMVLLSKTRVKPALDELEDISMALRHNGALAAEGHGSACLGNPAVAVAWLAEMLTRLGSGLRACDIAMSGALAKMIAAEPGSGFLADFGNLLRGHSVTVAALTA